MEKERAHLDELLRGNEASLRALQERSDAAEKQLGAGLAGNSRDPWVVGWSVDPLPPSHVFGFTDSQIKFFIVPKEKNSFCAMRWGGLTPHQVFPSGPGWEPSRAA